MRALGIAVLTGLSLVAAPKEDFRSLTQVASATYPQKTHYAVVCDYRSSKDDIDALAEALGSGYRITVIDMHLPEQVGAASSMLVQRHPDLLVLLPNDRVVRDGNIEATFLARSLKSRDIVTVGTKAVALRQGAAWAIGEGTGGELMVDPTLRGTVDVVRPGQAKSRQAYLGGRAEVKIARLSRP